MLLVKVAREVLAVRADGGGMMVGSRRQLVTPQLLETTALYAQVATDILREVVSPLGNLNTP